MLEKTSNYTKKYNLEFLQSCIISWLREQDLNLRPSGYELEIMIFVSFYDFLQMLVSSTEELVRGSFIYCNLL